MLYILDNKSLDAQRSVYEFRGWFPCSVHISSMAKTLHLYFIACVTLDQIYFVVLFDLERVLHCSAKCIHCSEPRHHRPHLPSLELTISASPILRETQEAREEQQQKHKCRSQLLIPPGRQKGTKRAPEEYPEGTPNVMKTMKMNSEFGLGSGGDSGMALGGILGSFGMVLKWFWVCFWDGFVMVLGLF